MGMSVCLSAGISEKPHDPTSLALFLFMLPMPPVARFSSDSVVIRYVLPVLWMTSYFHAMGFVVRDVYFYVARV